MIRRSINGPVLVPELGNIDARGITADIQKLKAEIEGTANYTGCRHLKKIESFGRIFTTLGFTTAWNIPLHLDTGQFSKVPHRAGLSFALNSAE